MLLRCLSLTGDPCIAGDGRPNIDNLDEESMSNGHRSITTVPQMGDKKKERQRNSCGHDRVVPWRNGDNKVATYSDRLDGTLVPRANGERTSVSTV